MSLTNAEPTARWEIAERDNTHLYFARALTERTILALPTIFGRGGAFAVASTKLLALFVVEGVTQPDPQGGALLRAALRDNSLREGLSKNIGAHFR